MKKIKAKGFVLRHFRMSDLQLYYELQQDEDIKKNFMGTPHTIKEAEKELREKLRNYRRKKPCEEAFAIEVEGELAGEVNVHALSYDHRKHRAVVSYWLARDHRGKGIASEALKLLTDYAFSRYKLKRIVGRCRTFNKASARVMEKAGFQLEGILRKNKFKDGKYLDDMLYAKIR
jgi:ribosomal-protein-alanine N-acetyltransferase